MLSFGEASEQAAGQVGDLLDYISDLSIVSPFETSQVEQITQIGLAAKLSADEVKQFTGAFLDYAAVHGVQDISFDAEQFLQLKQAGALTTMDLRQLRRMGIDVSRIIGTDMSGALADAVVAGAGALGQGTGAGPLPAPLTNSVPNSTPSASLNLPIPPSLRASSSMLVWIRKAHHSTDSTGPPSTRVFGSWRRMINLNSL